LTLVILRPYEGELESDLLPERKLEPLYPEENKKYLLRR
jgi:hypothetical protein